MNEDENPFQPPTQGQGRAATGVNSGSFADLKGIAKSQKGVIVCILIYLIAVVGQFAIPIEYRPLIGLGMLINGIVGMVFVFLLATKVYPVGLGIVLGILTLVPCLGLIVLLIVNAKATNVLKENGIQVGLMGAALWQFPSW